MQNFCARLIFTVNTLMAYHISHKEKKEFLLFTISIIVSALSQLFLEYQYLFLPFPMLLNVKPSSSQLFPLRNSFQSYIDMSRYEKHNVQPITKLRSTFSCEHFESYLNTLCFITAYPLESVHLNISQEVCGMRNASLRADQSYRFLTYASVYSFGQHSV